MAKDRAEQMKELKERIEALRREIQSPHDVAVEDILRLIFVIMYREGSRA
jgi:hypothetical protein